MKPIAFAAPLTAGIALLAAAAPGQEAPSEEPAASLRVVVFNVWELSREKLDRVDSGEGSGGAPVGSDPQLRSAAEVVQRLRPDVLLINEIDHDQAGENARLFQQRYLAVSQAGQAPIVFEHIVFEPSNTGVQSGFDLDNDGAVGTKTGDPEDAWGFGRYPGQYGMALYSRLPVARPALRTFRLLRWSEMPGNLIPDGALGRPDWYDAAESAALRLSSKSHWDVPLEIGGTVVHLLASHPTPTAFDGDEDRNGRRNHDEIRLWADYLSGGDLAAWIVDDEGRRGGLDPGASFVLLGDLNADPHAAPATGARPAIAQLLEHPRIADPRPASAGGSYMRRRPYSGDRARLTSDWGRIDYVLPSADLEVLGAGVFWPPPGDPLHRLVAGPARASDHRAVWVDLALDGDGRPLRRPPPPAPAQGSSR